MAIVATMSSMSTVDKPVGELKVIAPKENNEVINILFLEYITKGRVAYSVNIWCSSWSAPDSNGNQTRLCCTLTGTGSACDSETRNCGYCGPQ